MFGVEAIIAQMSESDRKMLREQFAGPKRPPSKVLKATAFAIRVVCYAVLVVPALFFAIPFLAIWAFEFGDES